MLGISQPPFVGLHSLMGLPGDEKREGNNGCDFLPHEHMGGNMVFDSVPHHSNLLNLQTTIQKPC